MSDTKPAKVGRPGKLTDTISKELCKYVKSGNYIETACGCVGIHKDTYYGWMTLGEKGRQPYKEFSDAIKKAFCQAEAWHVSRIASGAKGWQSSAWWLERYKLVRDNWRAPAVAVESDSVDRLVEMMEDHATKLKQGIFVPPKPAVNPLNTGSVGVPLSGPNSPIDTAGSE
jgi:hypothetical protein